MESAATQYERRSILTNVINRSAIKEALQEYNYDDLGQGRSRSVFVLHNGRRYPAKTIVVTAYNKRSAKHISAKDINSYDADWLLRHLGYQVETPSYNVKREQQTDNRQSWFEDADIDDDKRRRSLRLLAEREGQGAFRQALLNAYDKRCAISDCNLSDALDAAHIVPYRGIQFNHPTNGILLRCDLHKLFDRYHIWIDPENWQIHVSPSLVRSTYASISGRRLRLPLDEALWPDRGAIAYHREQAKSNL